MLEGIIDISHHNGQNLNFGQAATSGVVGVIHKATQGTGGSDAMLAVNRPLIRNAGLRFGAYHFGDGSDGGAQASFFLNSLMPQSGDLLVLDFEQNTAGPSMTLEEGRAFVTSVQQAVGIWPVLYGGHYLKEILDGDSDPVLSQCPLWVAQYGPAAVVPPGCASWTLWQYTDGSVPVANAVPGIGHCDRDRFNGASAGLASLWASASPS